MGTNTFQPDPRDVDDVAGHAFKAGLEAETTDQVEGHAYKIGLEAQPTDEVEGHVYRPGLDRLDTQAAASRSTSNLAEPAPKGDDEDDTEGHGRFNV